MCIPPNSVSHTYSHQTIWVEEMCTCRVSSHAAHLLISTEQCDIATILLLLSAWVRYAGTSRSLSKGGAYSLLIIGQVSTGKGPPKFFLPFRLMHLHLLGAFRRFAASIPDLSTKIFRTVV